MAAYNRLTLWLSASLIAAFGVGSVIHRPMGASDRALAVTSLKSALATLDDETLDPTTRLASYREGLRQTDALLRLAIRSTPVETATIERLATVRWESS